MKRSNNFIKIIIGILIIVFIALIFKEPESGLVFRDNPGELKMSDVQFCEYTDKEVKELRKKGVTESVLDGYIATSTYPRAVCDVLDAILESEETEINLTKRQEYEQRATKEEPTRKEKKYELKERKKEKKYEKRRFKEEYARVERFLNKDLFPLLEPAFSETGMKYKARIQSQGEVEPYWIKIEVSIDNRDTYYSLSDIEELIPENTNEQNIQVVFNTIDGSHITNLEY